MVLFSKEISILRCVWLPLISTMLMHPVVALAEQPPLPTFPSSTLSELISCAHIIHNYGFQKNVISAFNTAQFMNRLLCCLLVTRAHHWTAKSWKYLNEGRRTVFITSLPSTTSMIGTWVASRTISSPTHFKIESMNVSPKEQICSSFAESSYVLKQQQSQFQNNKLQNLHKESNIS